MDVRDDITRKSFRALNVSIGLHRVVPDRPRRVVCCIYCDDDDDDRLHRLLCVFSVSQMLVRFIYNCTKVVGICFILLPNNNNY